MKPQGKSLALPCMPKTTSDFAQQMNMNEQMRLKKQKLKSVNQ